MVCELVDNLALESSLKTFGEEARVGEFYGIFQTFEGGALVAVSCVICPTSVEAKEHD